MTACSTLARALAEPLGGTAPRAAVWLAVEQPGPWGRQAVTGSHLPAQVQARLTAASELPGVTVLLVRRPGPHADRHDREPSRQVMLANVTPGHRWLTRTTCDRSDSLLDLDLVGSAEAALAGAAPPWGLPDVDPVTLVCTNGRRDRCCAERGRTVARSLADRLPGPVWESSHLGGHRFSPTVLVLPVGAVYGGLDAEQLAATVTAMAAGVLPLAGLRGLTCHTPEQQAADIALRAGEGLAQLADTRPGPARRHDDGSWTVPVDSPTGSTLVRVDQVAQDPRAESCGADPVPRVDRVASYRRPSSPST